MFQREDVLGGLPARRASSVLYAIERRTAALAVQARQAMASYQTEQSAREREAAFLGAFSSGRTSRFRASVQDLERYAPAWAELVPEDAATRAALARLMSQTYRLPRELTPNITAVLGLDDPAVAGAFSRLHEADIDAVWVERPSLTERSRWWRSRIAEKVESLPPFWMAFALTLTEAVGLGILMVPVALAGIGPLPGLFLLIVLGIANMVTVGALVEAITRHGPMRYGSAYFGRLVSDLLGRSASVGMGVGLLMLNVVTLLAFYLSIGATLSGSTGIWAGVWIAVTCGINVGFLYRESIDATVASAILIGFVNLALIMLLVVLAVPYISFENATYANVPATEGALDPSALGLVFGVVLMAYFGHTSAANASKTVLRIDPGGGGLLWGSLAAVAVVIVLYCVTVFVFLGALGPEPLIGFGGTVLTPLAALVGPGANVIGSVYVTLAIGLGTIYYSLGAYNQVKEVFPRQARGDHEAGATSWLSRRWVRRLLAMLPTALVFALAETLVVLDSASIADSLSLAGTLAVPLIGGILPMLLIAAARRRGELVPEHVVRLLGRTWVVVALSLLFIVAVLVHGLVIWQEPVARLLALGVGASLILLVIRLLSARTFDPRAAVEVRRWGLQGARQQESVVSRGHSVMLSQPHHRDESVSVELPRPGPPELLVWAHQVTAEGESRPLSATVQVEGPEGTIVARELEDGRGTFRLGDGEQATQIDLTIDELDKRRTDER